jgi:hypothetical protein
MLQYDYDVVVLHSGLRVSQVIDDIEVLLGILVQRITDFTMSIETGGLQRCFLTRTIIMKVVTGSLIYSF